MPDSDSPKPSLVRIASVFGRMGTFTFGGGSAIVAALQREIVARLHWLDQAQFTLLYALSRVTPGTNILPFCTGSGWLLRRWRGALAALAAAAIPSCLIVWAATAGFAAINRYPVVRIAIAGAMAASIGILLSSSWWLVGPHLTRRRWLRSSLIVAASLALSYFAGLSPVMLLAGAAVLGFFWNEPQES